MKQETIIRITKWLMNFMYFAGIFVTLSLPLTLKWVRDSFAPQLEEYLGEAMIIYFVLGVLAVLIIGELRKMFRTVVADDCFVYGNVVSLQRMGTYSFLIALMSLVRTIVFVTPAMLVITLVFIIAGLFSKVLSFVFDKAIEYKLENDLTI